MLREVFNTIALALLGLIWFWVMLVLLFSWEV
jgi:hypothetical protein